MKKKLHPGALWSFRISNFIFLVFFMAIFFGWIFAAVVSLLFGNLDSGALIIVIGAILIYFIIAIILTEIIARMSYNRWFYEFTDSNLKVERGIIWKRYSNIPYERVQNVDIMRGIIARIFGFSSVNIQTAGYSGWYGRRGMPVSEGYIPAVGIEEAEQIREFLMKKITKNSKGI